MSQKGQFPGESESPLPEHCQERVQRKSTLPLRETITTALQPCLVDIKAGLTHFAY